MFIIAGPQRLMADGHGIDMNNNFVPNILKGLFDIFRHIELVDSTHLMLQRMSEGDVSTCGHVLTADFQTGGKGQGQNRWHSEHGKNLLMSLCWCPINLEASRQFDISMAVSLALVRLLDSLGVPEVMVKWPNDIWAGERKIAGILITNTVSGHLIANSIISVGLNINQQNFPSELPNPVSVSMLTGMYYDRQVIMHQLISLLAENLKLINSDRAGTLQPAYLARMLGYGQRRLFKIAGEIREYKIAGVDTYGRILLLHHGEAVRAYDLSEAAMVQ